MQPAGTNDYIIGNIGDNPTSQDIGCIPGVTYAYNVWTNRACSSTDRVSATLPYVSSAFGSENFDLACGSGLDGVVTGTASQESLGDDIDGVTRALGDTTPGAEVSTC